MLEGDFGAALDAYRTSANTSEERSAPVAGQVASAILAGDRAGAIVAARRLEEIMHSDDGVLDSLALAIPRVLSRTSPQVVRDTQTLAAALADQAGKTVRRITDAFQV